jgi:hypothetical protein
VYSRNGSSNTPIDRNASETELEKMWRQRFGLDKSPAARVKKYLLDVDNWVQDQSTAFYEPFPEFTIQEDFGALSGLASDQEWSRGEIGYHYTPGNSATQMLLRYHQTCLSKIHVVVFDGTKKSIVAPRWEAAGAGRFYYYLEESVDYAYQCHLVASESGKDHSRGLSFTSGSEQNGIYDIPVFQNKNELKIFLSTFSDPPNLAPSTVASEQNRLWYDALGKYNKWKVENSTPPATITQP